MTPSVAVNGTDSSSLQTPSLSVLVVGAGIAGLSVAIGLGQKGFSVTVLEKSPSLKEFGASLSIHANGSKCLRDWGLYSTFEKVVRKPEVFQIRDGITDESIGRSPQNKGNFADVAYGGEVWMVNRQDCQAVLADGAYAVGAKIEFGVDIREINHDLCEITAEDGRVFRADVIVGADGLQSQVRKSIPTLKDVQPVKLKDRCWRCTVPRSRLQGNKLLQPILELEDEISWMLPGKFVGTWPMPQHRAIDIAACIHEDGPVPPGKWGQRADPAIVSERFQEACPLLRELFKHIDICVEWMLGDIPPLDTWRSESGSTVLVGDAAHAVLPYSASGGNSAIEDAACLAECLEWARLQIVDHGISINHAIDRATKAFEDIRKPRVTRMQRAGYEFYDLTAAEGDAASARNAVFRKSTEQFDQQLAVPEAERRSQPRPAGDMNTPTLSPPFTQWLYRYDAKAVAKEYLATLQ